MSACNLPLRCDKCFYRVGEGDYKNRENNLEKFVEGNRIVTCRK